MPLQPLTQADTDKKFGTTVTAREHLRDYAWKYFAFHAEQRMKTFHFFILIAGFIIAGFVSRVVDQKSAAAALAFLLSFMAMVFGKLEQRNRELVKKGEAALKHLDSTEGLMDEGDRPNPLKLFDLDDFRTKQFPQEKNIFVASLSYSMVLACVFWVLGLLGFVGGIACLWLKIRP